MRNALKVGARRADNAHVRQQDVVLDKLFQRYRTALAVHRGRSRDLTVVDAVLEARVVLYEHLVATGWDAPDVVRRQLALDALLLEQPPTAVAG